MPEANTMPAAKKSEKAPKEGDDWEAIYEELVRFSDLYQNWHIQAIDDIAYFKERGCFAECDLLHRENGGEHYLGTDETPPLLVVYKGSVGVNHRRHDGSRSAPFYIFMGDSATPVRVTDPFDKSAYIERSLKNSETWEVRFDRGETEAIAAAHAAAAAREAKPIVGPARWPKRK